MKLKFPAGVMQYFDAEGNEHRPGPDGTINVANGLADRIKHMKAAGFTEVEVVVEPAVEVKTEAEKDAEESPVPVLDTDPDAQ